MEEHVVPPVHDINNDTVAVEEQEKPMEGMKNHLVTFGIAAVDQLIHRMPLGESMLTPYPVLTPPCLDLPFDNGNFQETSQRVHQSMSHNDAIQNGFEFLDMNQLNENDTLSTHSDLDLTIFEDGSSDSFDNSDSETTEGWGDAMDISAIAKLVCLVCGRPFPNLQERNRHEKFSHKNRQRETCKMCGVFFYDKANFIQHIENHLRDDNPGEIETEFTKKWFTVPILFCGYCDVAYIDMIEYEKHLMEHDIKNREASLNESSASSVQRTRVIQKTNKKVPQKYQNMPNKLQKKFHCNVCELSYVHRRSLLTHMKKIHINGAKTQQNKLKINQDMFKNIRNKFTCDFCGFSYMHKKTIVSHIITKHLPNEAKKIQNKFTCDFCGLVYMHKKNILVHITAKHINQVSSEQKTCNLKCHVCYKIYPHRRSLSQHLRKVHGLLARSSYTCKYCKSIFVNQDEYKNHMETIHNVSLDLSETKACNLCTKLFKTKAGLSGHKRSAHNPTKVYFDCIYCNRKFSNKQLVESHMKQEHCKTFLPCDICSNTYFKTVYDYNWHYKRHGTPKTPYKCKDCEMVTFDKKWFLNHMKSKHNIRYFQCNLCPVVVRKKCNLLRHKMGLHDLKKQTYTCNHCNMSFKQPLFLRKHLQNIHKLESKNT